MHQALTTVLNPSRTAEVERREKRVLRWCAILALALGCAWPLSFNLVDPDLWGHVRFGQDWLATGELPRTATYTFTAEDYRWINHENLAELVLAACYETFGVNGMLLAKLLLGMAIVLAMVWVAGTHGVNPLVSWTLMLLVTTNLQPFFPLRPQLFSFALCAAALVLLDRGFRDWNEHRSIDSRYLWYLPLVMAIWVNSHGGFVAGLAIVGAYLGGRIVELAWYRGDAAWAKVALLTAVGITCIAATLINPYGWQLHRWLAISLIEARPEITEWMPPHPSDPVFWPWFTMVAVIGISWLGTRERRDRVKVVILLLVIWQSALHLRHVAFVAILCGFWVPVHFQSMLYRLLPSNRNLLGLDFSPWFRRVAAGVLLFSIAVQSFAVDNRLSDFPVDRERFPVDAIQFMADRNLEGKLVVAFNWSQYAIAALSPKIHVGFDGRYDTCYPIEVVDMHFDFLLGEADGKRNRNPNSGPIDGKRVLEFNNPDLVLIDRQNPRPLEIMHSESEKPNPQWVLLYSDQVAELWGRASKYADPASSHYIPLSHRVTDAGPRKGSVPWPALPVESESREFASHPIPVQSNANL